VDPAVLLIYFGHVGFEDGSHGGVVALFSQDISGCLDFFHNLMAGRNRSHRPKVFRHELTRPFSLKPCPVSPYNAECEIPYPHTRPYPRVHYFETFDFPRFSREFLRSLQQQAILVLIVYGPDSLSACPHTGDG